MLNKQFIGEHKLFLFIGFLTFVLLFTVMNINHRFTATDFEVYYYAAKAFLAGKPIYEVAFGNSDVGFYKYSPFSLLFYIPATFLPFKIAASVNYFFLAAAGLFSIMISSYLVVKKVFATTKPVTNTLLLITFFLSLTFFNREVRMGNTNNLLLLLICLAVANTGKQKEWVTGLLWAIAIAFKPYIIIVLLPVLMHHRFKIIASTISFSIIFSLIPLFFTGLSEGIDIYEGWYAAMLAHSNYIISPFTLDSLIHHYLGIRHGINLTWYITAIVILGYFAVKLFKKFPGKQSSGHASTEQFYLLESFTLLAIIPNLVNTDSQQLLYTIPLVAFLTQYLLEKRKLYLLLPYILLFFFFSVNQPDLLGRTASENLYRMGIVGISNLLIIGFSWIIFLREKKMFTNQSPAEV